MLALITTNKRPWWIYLRFTTRYRAACFGVGIRTYYPQSIPRSDLEPFETVAFHKQLLCLLSRKPPSPAYIDLQSGASCRGRRCFSRRLIWHDRVGTVGSNFGDSRIRRQRRKPAKGAGSLDAANDWGGGEVKALFFGGKRW